MAKEKDLPARGRVHPALRGAPTKIVPKMDQHSMPHDYDKLGTPSVTHCDEERDREKHQRGKHSEHDHAYDGDE